jgi:hypothetical protein
MSVPVAISYSVFFDPIGIYLNKCLTFQFFDGADLLERFTLPTMYESLCKYKNALGQPGEGIHSYRIADIAVADVIMTLVAAYLITLLFSIPFTYSAVGLFVAGIILHRVFCVRTTVDKMLFSSSREDTSQ